MFSSWNLMGYTVYGAECTKAFVGLTGEMVMKSSLTIQMCSFSMFRLFFFFLFCFVLLPFVVPSLPFHILLLFGCCRSLDPNQLLIFFFVKMRKLVDNIDKIKTNRWTNSYQAHFSFCCCCCYHLTDWVCFILISNGECFFLGFSCL